MKKTSLLIANLILLFLITTSANALLLTGRAYDKPKPITQIAPPKQKPQLPVDPEPEPRKKPKVPAPPYNPEGEKGPHAPTIPTDGGDLPPYLGPTDNNGNPLPPWIDDGFEGPHDHPVPTPEPATMLLLGVGLMGMAGVGRKFKQGEAK